MEIRYSELPNELQQYAKNINKNENNDFIFTEDGKGKSGNTIEYDLIEIKNETLHDIKPNISILNKYTIENNPLSIRRIKIKNGKFVPEYSFTMDNYKYLYINVDRISYNENSSIVSKNVGEDNRFPTYFRMTSDVSIDSVSIKGKKSYQVYFLNEKYEYDKEIENEEERKSYGGSFNVFNQDNEYIELTVPTGKTDGWLEVIL